MASWFMELAIHQADSIGGDLLTIQADLENQGWHINRDRDVLLLVGDRDRGSTILFVSFWSLGDTQWGLTVSVYTSTGGGDVNQAEAIVKQVVAMIQSISHV